MSSFKSIFLLLCIVFSAISCPDNCFHCDQDEVSCLICQQNFSLDATLNACAPTKVGYSYQDQSAWGGVCGSGNRQSPIDIVIRNIELCPRNKVMINTFTNSETNINPVGKDLTAVFADLSKMAFYESGTLRQFQSAQFHWHYPSEHTINGRPFDLELHIVHTQVDNPTQYSVIGLLFRINENLRMDIIDNLDFGNSGQSRAFNFPWSIRNKMFYHYKGSLTTPPCAEAVEWFVITETYEISRANYDRIKAAMGQPNSREVQSLNGRRPMFLGKFCNLFRRFN